jgi:hypothetical protein
MSCPWSARSADLVTVQRVQLVEKLAHGLAEGDERLVELLRLHPVRSDCARL